MRQLGNEDHRQTVSSLTELTYFSVPGMPCFGRNTRGSMLRRKVSYGNTAAPGMPVSRVAN